MDLVADGADVRRRRVLAARAAAPASSAACAPGGPSSWMRCQPRGCAQMLAQQLAGLRIEQPHVQVVPLHLTRAGRSSRAARRSRRLDLDAAVEMHGALAVLVVAKRLERAAGRARAAPRRTSRRPGASSCRGCACRPSALPSDRDTPAPPRGSRSAAPSAASSACGRRPTSTLPFAIGIADAARQRDDAVVREHVAVERIERRVVDVGREHALAQIVEDDDPHGAAEPAKRPLVQLGPDLRARLPGQQAHALAAVAERQDEEPRAPVLPGAAGRAPSARRRNRPGLLRRARS